MRRMVRTTKIPVVRNQLRSTKIKKKKWASLKKFCFVVIASMLILLYVVVRVETEGMYAKIEKLKQQHNELQSANAKLSVEVDRLSEFTIIEEIAKTKLGLVVVPHEFVE